MSTRWLVAHPTTGRLWVTEARYSFEEFQHWNTIPVCPLADVQAGDVDAVRDLIRGTILHAD